ncbi:MAG: lysozyme inhibitor LprI family protein [Janthinobacterium lividum]
MTAETGFTRSPDLNSTNWGTEPSELTSTPKFAKSKAICQRLVSVRPSERDQPTPGQIKVMKGCSSEQLYYGEGVTPDYLKARLCAFSEMDGGNRDAFSGATILMQIYANGLGTARNLDLATLYACELDGAPAENDGRVQHIQTLRANPEHFDYCDDITSGEAEGICQLRKTKQTAIRRDAKLKLLVGSLPAVAKALYAPMHKAFDAFVGAHGDGEVDFSGTGGAAMQLEEQDSTRDQFTKDLERLLAGHWPSTADAKVADTQLNARYQRAIAWATSNDDFTTVKPENIRIAERAWLTYRDAFARFALVAASNVRQEAVLAYLTKLRIAQLDQLHA